MHMCGRQQLSPYLSASWDGKLYHGLQQLRSNYHWLASQTAASNSLLLNAGHVLAGYLRADNRGPCDSF